MTISIKRLYECIKDQVEEAGYHRDIVYYQTRDLDAVTPASFLGELAYVILNSGMKNHVVEIHWGRFMKAFDGFSDLPSLVKKRQAVKKEAMGVFKNQKKVDAILDAVKIVNDESWDTIREELKEKGINYLTRFGYIGDVTKFHLAKNIGYDCIKPDRHLVRCAKAAGYDHPEDMCLAIATEVGDTLSVIDYIIWRYCADIEKDYLDQFADVER